MRRGVTKSVPLLASKGLRKKFILGESISIRIRIGWLLFVLFSFTARAEYTEIPASVRENLLEPYRQSLMNEVASLAARDGLADSKTSFALIQAETKQKKLADKIQSLQIGLSASDLPLEDADAKQKAKNLAEAIATLGDAETKLADLERRQPDNKTMLEFRQTKVRDARATVEKAKQILDLVEARNQLKENEPKLAAARTAAGTPPPPGSPQADLRETYQKMLAEVDTAVGAEEKRLLDQLNATKGVTAKEFDESLGKLSDLFLERNQLDMKTPASVEKAQKLDREILALHEKLVLQNAQADPSVRDHIAMIKTHIGNHLLETGSWALMGISMGLAAKFGYLAKWILFYGISGAVFSFYPLVSRFYQTRDRRELIPMRHRILGHIENYQDRLQARRAAGEFRGQRDQLEELAARRELNGRAMGEAWRQARCMRGMADLGRFGAQSGIPVAAR